MMILNVFASSSAGGAGGARPESTRSRMIARQVTRNAGSRPDAPTQVTRNQAQPRTTRGVSRNSEQLRLF